jgi:hypothetical protein
LFVLKGNRQVAKKSQKKKSEKKKNKQGVGREKWEEKKKKKEEKKKKIRNCACISNALKQKVGYWLYFLFFFLAESINSK